MKHLKRISIGTCMAIFLAACGSKTEKPETTTAAAVTTPDTIPAGHQGEPDRTTTGNYKKGDPVPANLVCMVNNAFMGKEQLAVPFNGKTYYGCCEMCKSRIPKDATVRIATDPATGKPVDKAAAYIVITGDNGEVSYFENIGSYKKLAQGH